MVIMNDAGCKNANDMERKVGFNVLSIIAGDLFSCPGQGNRLLLCVVPCQILYWLAQY